MAVATPSAQLPIRDPNGVRRRGNKVSRAGCEGHSSDEARPEVFALGGDGRSIIRRVTRRDGTCIETVFELPEPLSTRKPSHEHLARLADLTFLRLSAPPMVDASRPSKRLVDLFSGCGAMSLGVAEACRALGYRLLPVLAVDTNPAALRVYEKNLRPVDARLQSVSELLGEPETPLSRKERDLADRLGTIDIVVGGPPCQGHSDLNNHTRRRDPRNALYGRMARLAEVVQPIHLIVENVSAVLHDKSDVVGRTKRTLIRLGYYVDDGIIDASLLGVPQMRRRHILVASRLTPISLAEITERYGRRPRPTGWAIGDLRRSESSKLVDRVARPSKEMQRRIDYLFDNDCYDLPNGLRPPCHRRGDHTYKSVYGRMRWDRPAQTITSGFTCMGQGRFVHPKERRTITPHEAARLQFIPDFFDFEVAGSKTAIVEMIGNAVPVKLSYVLALELMR